jgi:hypothetical protein
MIPDVATVQNGTLIALATGVLPHLSVPYAIGTAGAAAGLLAFMAQDADRAVERRVNEINGMQDIFAEAAEHFADRDATFARTLDSRSRDIFTRFNLSDLDERRREHLPVLIELHERVEAEAADWARALERKILTHLREVAHARALYIPQLG